MVGPPDVKTLRMFSGVDRIPVCDGRTVRRTDRHLATAVYEIFSVKEWRDLENQVWGCSRSLNFVKMFDAGKTRMIELPYGEKTVTIC